MAAYGGPPLSRSALRSIVVDGATDLRPVLQVIDLKLLSPGDPVSATRRYRLELSDGEHYHRAALATQPNELAKNGTIYRNAVVRVNECVHRAAGVRARAVPRV